MVASASGDVLPLGAAIRNWGTLDQVYIAVEWHDPGPNDREQETWAELFHYSCSDGDVCATATLVGSDDLLDPVLGNNLTHVSLAIHKPSIVEVLAVLRQKLQPDCDNDANTGPLSLTEQGATDLSSVLWNHVSGPNSEEPVSWNTVGTCENVGVTRARFLGGDRWACYTHTQGGSDRVACNDNSSTAWWGLWSNEEHMGLSSGGGVEDHPSFAFYGSSHHLAVSGTRRKTGNNSNTIDLHFPDEAGDPIVPIEPPSGPPDDVIENNDTEASGGVLTTVYVDGKEGDARVMFQSCDTAAVDCTDPGNWTANEDVVADSTTGFHFDAQFSQIALDGDRQFVVWQYDTDDTGSDAWRVAVATRCGTGAWAIADVRTPSTGDEDHDQFIAVGRPSLVLNRNENIAHVVFAEGEGYPGRWTLQNVQNTDVYWYRKGYAACN